MTRAIDVSKADLTGDVSKPDLLSIHTNVRRSKIFEHQYFRKENLDTSEK